MKTSVLAIICSLFGLLISCGELRLSQDDLKWQPYEVGDLLVFESNKSEIDSIKVVDVSSHVNPKNHQSPFSNKYETLFVSGELLNPKKEFRHATHINLLEISWGEKEAHMLFNLLKMSDSLEYAQAEYRLNELNDFYGAKSKINNKCINDVILLIPNSTYKLEYDLKTYWWSKKYGYVRYDFKNGYHRKLKRFIRNGKNILPMCSN